MGGLNGNYWDQGINLVSGCTPVSEGCLNCWHRAMLKRFGKQDPDRVIVHPERIRRLERGRPRIVAIWADLFHPDVPDDFIGQVLDAAARGPHQVLILTKRAERMGWFFAHCPIPDNVWPGVTIEGPGYAKRAYWVRDLPRAWASIEPILDDVDPSLELTHFDWVVVGCETGPGARVCAATNKHIIRVIDHCLHAGVPVWVKATVEYGEPNDWIVRQRPVGLTLSNKGSELSTSREHENDQSTR